jgi:glutaconate CoA-transferase, subunit A
MTALAAAVAVIPDGASVGLGRPGALALVRELLRLGRRDLDIVAAPTGSLAVELLIAGGAVRSIESSGVDFGELGFAPAFTRAIEEGRVESRDST